MGTRPWAFALCLGIAASVFVPVPSPRSAAEDGGTPGPSADWLVAQLAADFQTARDEAAFQLVEIGAAAVPALAKALVDEKLRAPALDVIARLGPIAKDAVPDVAALAKDAANPSRAAAARTLGAIGADAQSALPALTGITGDVKSKSQSEAADAIAQIAADLARRASPPCPMAERVQKSIAAGLDWLDRHQGENGLWSGSRFAARCTAGDPCAGPGRYDYQVGVTALAAIAHLAAHETPRRGEHRAAIAKALAALVRTQRKDGLLATSTSDKETYEHGAATLALAEALRLTHDPVYEAPTRRACTLIERARNPDFGWRYDLTPRGQNDTSVVAWMVRALATAAEAGIDVDPKAIGGGLAWVESSTDSQFGRTGYQQTGGPPARLVSDVELHPADQSEALTATGLLVRLAAGRRPEADPMIAKGVALLAKKLPAWKIPRVDLYYWVHASEALRRIGGPERDAWNAALAEALVENQSSAASGCVRGSWAPIDPWSNDAGRVYATALCVISLANWTEPPPEKKPPPPPSIRATATVLERQAKSTNPLVAKAAQHALDAIRAAFAPK